MHLKIAEVSPERAAHAGNRLRNLTITSDLHLYRDELLKGSRVTPNPCPKRLITLSLSLFNISYSIPIMPAVKSRELGVVGF